MKNALILVLICLTALAWRWPRSPASNELECGTCRRAQLEVTFYRLMFEEIQQSWNEQQIEKQNLIQQYRVVTNGYERQLKNRFELGYVEGKIDFMNEIAPMLDDPKHWKR
jgi:hypothetical protein